MFKGKNQNCGGRAGLEPGVPIQPGGPDQVPSPLDPTLQPAAAFQQEHCPNSSLLTLRPTHPLMAVTCFLASSPKHTHTN